MGITEAIFRGRTAVAVAATSAVLGGWAAQSEGAAPSGSSGGTAPTSTPPASKPMTLRQKVRHYYRNPLRRIRHLYAMRIDEGVDYAGSGPIKALGAARILAVDRGTSTFWANVDGNVVVEWMLKGPLKGIAVYSAENCTPNASLYVGELVNSNTTLCHLNNAYPNLETGFAHDDSSGVPMAWAVYQHYPDGSKTAYGADFSRLLGDLGAPQGNTNPGAVSYDPSKTIGKLPKGFPRF